MQKWLFSFFLFLVKHFFCIIETVKMIHGYVRSKYFCNNLSFTNLNNWYLTKIEEFVIQKVKAMRMERKMVADGIGRLHEYVCKFYC